MSARDRARALSRLLRVQEQRHQLAEWKRIDLSRRLRAVEEAEAATIAALDDDASPLAGLFVEQTARRLELLGRRRRELECACEAQAAEVRAQAVRAKTAAALHKDAARTAGEEARRIADLDVLEAFLAREAAEDATHVAADEAAPVQGGPRASPA